MAPKIEKLETIRVTFDDGIYCDITPDAAYPEFHAFIFNKIGLDNPGYVFSLKLQSEAQALELAEIGYHQYYEYLVEIDESDDE